MNGNEQSGSGQGGIQCKSLPTDIFSGFGSIWTIFSVVMSVTLLIYAVTESSNVNHYYLTSTFYSTYDSDLPQLTWNPYGPDNFNILTQVAFKCLQASTVSPCPTDVNYTACLYTKSPAFQSCTQNRTALTPTAVYSSVWSCASASFPVSQGMYSAYTLCSGQESSPAVLDVLQDVYTSTMLGSYNWVIMLVTSMWLMSSFGVYTLWCFNENVLFSDAPKMALWTARMGPAWSIAAFSWNIGAVSFLSASAWRAASSGGQAFVNVNEPMSIQTTVVCVGFSVVASLYLMSEFWEASEVASKTVVVSNQNSYTVSQASYSSIPAKERSLYMLSSERRDLENKYRRRKSGVAPLRYSMRSPSSSSMSSLHSTIVAPDPMEDPASKMVWKHDNNNNTGKENVNPSKNNNSDMVMMYEGNEDRTTPLLMCAWADCWVFVDPMMAIAFVGVSPDIVTAEVCNIFTNVFYSRLCYSVFQRLFYEAYTPSSSSTGKDRNLSVSAMSVWGNLGCMWYSVVASMLLLWRYSAVPMVVAYAYLVLVVPCLYWLIVHILMESYREMRPRFYAELAFQYGVLIRTVLATCLFFLYGVAGSASIAANNELEHLFKEFTM